MLFDFNGTLSADESVVAEIIADIADTHLGIYVSRAEYFARFVGHTERAMLAELVQQAGVSSPAGPVIEELLRQFLASYLVRTRDGACILPNTRALICELSERGIPLGLVTAAPAAMVMPSLRASGLTDSFSTVVTLDEVEFPKPDPAGYLLALRRLGLADGVGVVAVEDSRVGLVAARAAGLSTVGIIGSMSAAQLAAFADETVHSLSIESCLMPSVGSAEN